MTDDKIFESLLKQAAYFRALFDHKKHKPSFPIHFGWAILYKREETDKYEACPCGAEAIKYKFCCWTRTKEFRKRLKE